MLEIRGCNQTPKMRSCACQKIHSLSRRWGLGLMGPTLTQLHLLFPLGYRLRIRDLHRKDSWMQDQEPSRDVIKGLCLMRGRMQEIYCNLSRGELK